MTDKKHKPSITPEAAKILEQYRNAGKPQSADGSIDPAGSDGNGAARPTSPPPPSPMRRSGTRGK
jgi:hypothetical protein